MNKNKQKSNENSQILKKQEPSSWQKEQSYQELLDSLRDTYLAYKETAGRRKLELRPRKGPGAGSKMMGQLPVENNDEQEFKEFYLQPQVDNVPQLDEPEKQKKWRGEFLNDVCSRPDPEPLTYLADTLHLEQLQKIEDRSKPSSARKDLADFFKRLSVHLQHKKYKMLGRWADQTVSSQIIDMQSNYFDLMVGRLQMEYDSAYNRAERLQVEDNYDLAVNPLDKRPQPISSDKNDGKEGENETTLLYNEKSEKSINSLIRMDDVEVYLRIQTYREKLFRHAQKLANGIKWLPYQKRWGIFKKSRIFLGAYKTKYNEQQNIKISKLSKFSKEELVKIGVQEDRLLDQICKKFTQHLKLEEYSRQDNKLLSSYKCNHEKPPFLFLSDYEFKEQLVPLAKESKLAIGEFQKIDGGRQASYQVDTLFPAEFQKQALAIQFDWLDTGLGTQADTDILIIQKLTQELQIDKNEMLDQMAKQAETERKKSILGQLSKDIQNSDQSGKKSKKANSHGLDEAEEVARNNLIRRVKDMRFFSLDPTQCKLKNADWLNYVCWLPNVSEQIKRQNHYLSSPDENPIDSLLQSAFEFLDVNESGAAIKILEDSATAHVRKVKGYYSEISQSIIRPQNDPMGTVEQILNNATFGIAEKLKDQSNISQENTNYNQTNIEEYLQKIDPLKFDLVKSYYMLRLLKSRGLKAKLLHTLNYFRAVQKRLAFDVREFFTREKALGGQLIEDALIGPQFGKDDKGNLRAKAGGSTGPGGINQTRIQRQLDEGSYETNLPDGKTIYDLVSLKGYKYNKRFNPQLTSTCPCVPKFHTTFGRPTLYQDISKETENNLIEPGRWKAKANPIPSTKDRLVFKLGDQKLTESEIYILDEHGIQIMYSESLNDMLILEEEMIKIGSYYLNKAEVAQFVCSQDPPSTMMDRAEITLQLFENELEFQIIKVQLIELLLEAYNHVCDPLESVRLLQIISDIMAIRPRINLEATYFQDSYDSEKKALQERFYLYKEFMSFQKSNEHNENLNQKKFQELKMRKLFDFIQGKWQYKKQQNQIERISAKEEQTINKNIEQDQNVRKAKALLEIQRQQDLKEIAERHITEFAGDQHTDFAQVLGLPQVTAADLFKRQGQLDPLLIDASREHCNFSKQIEGYPWFFVGKNQYVENIGFEIENSAATDFYESLICITRVHASCEQAIEELRNIHNPENGLASSCLDRAFISQARLVFGSIKIQFQESQKLVTKSKNQIEQDFYLSSSDKLVFLMRELKASFNPDLIQVEASPILISKLDIQEVTKFDFPRLKLQDAQDYDQLNDEQLTEKMIDLAKISIIKKKYALSSPDLNQEDNQEFLGSSKQSEDEKVQSPSLLIFACNAIEVHRLRSQLIQEIYETDILSQIYTYQLKKTDKPSEKLVGAASTTFDTRQITRENANYVDYNDGTKLDIDLPFIEFDPSLKASLDFQSESCVKALLTNLGVEELRAVLRYQLMQKQILSISVQRNQALMDGPQQGLKEIKWLGRRYDPFCIPASMLNMKELFMGALDGPSSTLCKREQQRMSSNLSKEIGPFIMSISAIKTRHKASVGRKWSQLYQKIINTEKPMETQLRILRSYRLRLLHEYCIDIMKEIYVESLPLQTILVCRELKFKAQLFPKELNLLKINQGSIIEHLPFELSQKRQDNFQFDQTDQQLKLSDLSQGRPKNLLFVPSYSEIMEHSRTAVQEGQAASGSNYLTQVDEENIDLQLKYYSKGPIFLSQQEIIQQVDGRQVSFKQYLIYPLAQTQILQLFSQLLQIVSLEYFMGRNNASGPLILALEDQIYSGRNFWTNQPHEVDDDKKKKIHQEASQRVIQEIMKIKRRRIDLSQDMEQISKRLLQINDFLKSNNSDQLKLSFILELMKMQHQASYLQMLSGIENSIDLYLDHKSQDYFEKLQEIQAVLSRRDHGFNLLGNGHYFNNANRESQFIDPSSICLQDHNEFLKGYQSVIDESSLVPIQPTLVRRLFGRSSKKIMFAKPAFLSQQVPCYSYLKSSFLNMDDEQRQFLATNFFQIDEGLYQYLVFLGLALDKSVLNKDGQSNSSQVIVVRPKDVLQAKIDYLGLKVEQKQLQRVLMCWSISSQLPNNINDYLKAIDLYREHTMLKALLQRDELISKYYESNSKDTGDGQGVGLKKAKSIKATILDNVNTGSREHQMLVKVSQIKAEIQVTSRTLDIEMIKMSRNMIEREHESLIATFEQAAAHDKVLAMIHPQQQFASTLYQSVDRNSHLDVVNKLGFVQVFLTKLRNRCTEVETLASGPGIVFSLKDFNECLQNFCQGALKYSEAELRTRVENQYIRQYQYQHLIYMKEKQAYYYRRKCEQFLENIDKIVNSKISQKGSQLIYELDVASRELRVLKDNFRLMQALMMSELRHEYMRAIHERQAKIQELRDCKKLMGDAVKSETLAMVQDFFSMMQQQYDHVKRTGERPEIEYKQRLQAFQIDHKPFKGQQKQTNFDNLQYIEQIPLITEKGNPLISARERKDILDLKQCIKKLKVFQMMKNVGAQERHERELANLRAQLTSNAALWDQLAEAEKREQITKQELTMTKLSLASYEKLIEKLQGQLENLNNQKARLQQFKNSKSKRIDELENKMKDLEILENIDLNRILTELKNRDKKIEELKLLNNEGKEHLQGAQQKRTQKDIYELKSKIAQERDLKLQAYERLEGLRIEMRALEGKDIKSDLWKEKCKELFEMCKDLENENTELKAFINEANKTNMLLAQDNINYANSLNVNPIDEIRSHGQPSLGNRYPAAGLGERMFTHRTLGAMVGVKQKKFQPGRLASGGGIFSGYPLGVFPASIPSSSKGVDPSNQLQETVFTDNYNSLKYSGAGQIVNQIADAQDIIQMGGLGMFAEQSINSGNIGTRDSFPGSAVLAGPLLNFQQHPRGIMTAGGGARQLNGQAKKATGIHEDGRLQSHDPSQKNNGKQLNLNSQWNNMPQSMMNRNQIAKIQQQRGKTFNKINDIQSDQMQGRFQGKQMNLGGITIQRSINQGIPQKQQSQEQLGINAINQTFAANKAQQPMNVNINFNTTNISLNK